MECRQRKRGTILPESATFRKREKGTEGITNIPSVPFSRFPACVGDAVCGH